MACELSEKSLGGRVELPVFFSKDDARMPRSNHLEAISAAIQQINSLPSLEDLGESAVKQGIVLRILSSAGWDTFDLSEVQPEFRSGNSRVDFALMPPSSRGRITGAPLALVEVKPVDDDLEKDRYERQMAAHCSRNGVHLSALTNGTKWLLLYWSEETEKDGSRYSEIDLAGDPASAAEEINRYLSKDRVQSGQAARSAERVLYDRNRDESSRQAILDGWRQVVRGMDEGLVELVATAAEQKAGGRPENRFIRRVLMEHRAELLPFSEADAAGASSSTRGTRRRPASFSFQSETHSAASWPDLLVGICEIMRQRHPESFERILDIRGRTLPYFSRNEDDVHLPRQIGDSGIYASCQGAGVLIEGRAQKVVESFGYPKDSLSVQTR